MILYISYVFYILSRGILGNLEIDLCMSCKEETANKMLPAWDELWASEYLVAKLLRFVCLICCKAGVSLCYYQ